MKYFASGIILLFTFVMGIYFDRAFELKDRVTLFIKLIYNKCKRFIRHIISLSAVYVVLIIAYYISEKLFNYGDSILSNLISTALSIVFIDFLLKERALDDKAKVSELIKGKIINVREKIQVIILKFVSLESLKAQTLSDDIISSILEKESLAENVIDFIYFTDDGQAKEIKICKFDYIYYVSKEIKSDVTILIQSFNQYLSTAEMVTLIKLKELLDKNNIFKVRYSTYENVTTEEYNFYKGLLIEAILELNSIALMFEKRDIKYGNK